MTNSDRAETVPGHLRHASEGAILIEAATESEWLARCLEELGHEVIVAESNYAPMYAHSSRRAFGTRLNSRAMLASGPANGVPAGRSTQDRRTRFSARHSTEAPGDCLIPRSVSLGAGSLA